PNLVVTRSFSKAFGLASLRCGYLLAQPALCAMVNKIRVGKHVNALAQVAAAAALDDIPHMLAYVEEVRMAKAWVLRELERRGVPVISTPANFILFRVNEPEKVLSFFENHNIYLRNRSMLPGLTGYLRLTVGSREVMGHFWNVFEKIPSQFI
ncbi:MAG TPA: aminotransferase class I/II-fold pyridoxal phosphate-dependent enzyme, partial [bacterium]|nr:aminotransferase class I/II-fold pyridoxal phosphate-dependent enzyme [bacterium]